MPLSFPYPTFCETGGYNELLSPDGEIRPHWRAFFKAAGRNGKNVFPAYAEQAARLMNIGAQDGGTGQAAAERGVIPFILSGEDFKTVSAGLKQRAELINRILCDLYGGQELISRGVIPPQTVYSAPSYIPALKSVRPAGGVFLQEYAADLERAPDGRFRVVADKTQTPEDVGQAVKNRLVLSRVMPDIYAAVSPARIFDFFEAMRRHLFACAPARDKTKIPLIVLLSGKIGEKPSFEEAFFARSLGVSVVDPADLTVRGDRVYLKNIDGLKPVDVILRRIDDLSCDPLELNGASPCGVAGLTRVARKGNVALINPLGTGLAETPALRPFFRDACRYFNGCDPLLPDAAEGESVNASLTPVLRNGVPVPARARLRFHLIYENGGYRILKGGLAFTQTDVSGLSDIWVETENRRQKDDAAERIAAVLETKPVRTTFELTSRIADNMFWLGRNLERGEQLARLLRVTVERATECPEIPEPDDVATLMNILALSGHLPFKDYQNPDVREQALEELKKIAASPDYGFGLHFLFSRMKETADLLHDRLSMDTWELFTRLLPLLPEPDAGCHALLNRLNGIILRQNALSGLICENMTRDHGWRFLEIGRRLERGLQILNLLSGIDFCADKGFNASLETLLETSDSRMTYRARYMALPTVPLVFDLLVCDDGNPRAVIYQALELRRNISALEKESSVSGLFSKESRILEETIGLIRNTDVMKPAGKAGTLNETAAVTPAFGGLLNDLRLKLQEFSDTLTLSCFVHTASTRQEPAYGKGRMK